jgi:hypothetical protein
VKEALADIPTPIVLPVSATLVVACANPVGRTDRCQKTVYNKTYTEKPAELLCPLFDLPVLVPPGNTACIISYAHARRKEKMVRYIPQKLAGIYHRYGLMSRVFPATLTILCLIRMIGYVGYSAPFIICEGGMIVATTIITSPNKPTFNIIEREPVFVNPCITLMRKFSQSPPLEFAIHNIVSMRVFVNTWQQ